jgi:hypothetical protein
LITDTRLAKPSSKSFLIKHQGIGGKITRSLGR